MKCKAGHTITAFQHNLLSGHTSRCTICGNGKLMDLTRLKFGRLTVIQRGPDYIYDGGGEPRWFCMCDCDNHMPSNLRKVILIRGSDLRSGSISSCGCYRKIFVKQSNENRKIAKLNYMVGLVPYGTQIQPNSVQGVSFVINEELDPYKKELDTKLKEATHEYMSSH